MNTFLQKNLLIEGTTEYLNDIKQISITDVGGNKSLIFQINRELSPEQYKELAKLAFSLNEIDQVGFWLNESRLIMSEGETCINAIISLGILKKKKREMRIYSSGVKNRITINSINGISYFTTEDLVEEIREISPELSLVVLNGIAFIVSLNSDINIEEMLNSLDSLTNGAFNALGVVLLEQETNSIKPYIFLKKLNKLTLEQSCGSGSIAAAYVLEQLTGNTNIKIQQPSGEIVGVRIVRFNRKGKNRVVTEYSAKPQLISQIEV